MTKLFLLTTTLLVLLSSFGCSFIKERFFKPDGDNIEQKIEQEINQEEKRKDSGPIPVNPHHS